MELTIETLKTIKEKYLLELESEHYSVRYSAERKLIVLKEIIEDMEEIKCHK